MFGSNDRCNYSAMWRCNRVEQEQIFNSICIGGRALVASKCLRWEWIRRKAALIVFKRKNPQWKFWIGEERRSRGTTRKSSIFTVLARISLLGTIKRGCILARPIRDESISYFQISKVVFAVSQPIQHSAAPRCFHLRVTAAEVICIYTIGQNTE